MPPINAGKLETKLSCAKSMLPELSMTKRKSTASHPSSGRGASGKPPTSNLIGGEGVETVVDEPPVRIVPVLVSPACCPPFVLVGESIPLEPPIEPSGAEPHAEAKEATVSTTR